MSSALLYLAIVAIWACVLVPRWLRRSHSADPDDLAPSDDLASSDDGRRSEPGALTGEADGDTAVSASGEAGDSPADPARNERAATARRSAAARGDRPQTDVEHATRLAGLPKQAGQSHAKVLQARRRMLIAQLALLAAAAALPVAHLAPWWVIAPPAGLLCVYLLLLREAGRADADNARRMAYAEERAADAASQRPEHTLADGPPPTATVIDISGRVGDQFYDQYADAAARAVGD